MHTLRNQARLFKVAFWGLRPVPNESNAREMFDRRAEMSVRVWKRAPAVDIP